MNNLLSHILIQPNVITDLGLNEILNQINNSKTDNLKVFDVNKTNQTNTIEWVVDKEVRDTKIVEMGDIFPKIKSLFECCVREIINPFYNIEVESSEIPQILSYSVGGHYKPHIDGESLWISPNKETIWRKIMDRDLTILFFINDKFEGGDLIFPDLKIRIRPEPGMLICFPSSHHYVHGVEPVTQGKRYSIITWAKIKGFESREDKTKKNIIKYQ